MFSFLVLADNIFGIPAGTYDPAVDDGVYVMLQPLPPGPHVLHFTGTFSPTSSLDVTYQLTVSH